MKRKKQYEVLVDLLRSAPNHTMTIREIHVQGYLQNPADAKMRAVKKGFNITTEYLDPSNPKIASYKLHEKPPKVHYDESQHVPNRLQRKILENYDQVQLFPTNQRHYE